jgi:hypothetical protein
VRRVFQAGTGHRCVRRTAAEPPPAADPFEPGLNQVRFVGSPVDDDGRYAIVGSAQNVESLAPPELGQFLFGTTSLTDVEFAVEERGVLVPA